MNELTDAMVVEAFVRYLAEEEHPGLHIESRPDLANRSTADIDAVAGPFAIEHTSIDTVENQRRDGSQFGSVANRLEEAFQGRLPFRLRLIFPYDGIVAGQDWDAIRMAIETWVSEVVPTLADGVYTTRVAGVPFDVSATKVSDRPPGLFCMRLAPPDDDLAGRCGVILNRKAGKLKAYKAQGKTTVILLESRDMALMNVHKLAEAVRGAFPSGLPGGVDELWHADASVPAVMEFWNLGEMIRQDEHAV
ncbi:MAG: hypothetical protein U0163_00135 [Gemmatimonadaceae bacterium]